MDVKKRKAYVVLWGRLKEGDHLRYLGVGGNDNTETDIKYEYIGNEDMDCFQLAKNKDQLWALMMTLMKCQFP